jgi:hypothetical protein
MLYTKARTLGGSEPGSSRTGLGDPPAWDRTPPSQYFRENKCCKGGARSGAIEVARPFSHRESIIGGIGGLLFGQRQA